MCREKNNIDLHIHTTKSDGEYTPGDVIIKAIDAGLQTIAITDHDSFTKINTGINEIEIINGIEISTEYDGIDLHLLVYDFNDNSSLVSAIEEIELRNIRMYINFIKNIDNSKSIFKRKKLQVHQIIKYANKSKGIVVIAHPKRLSPKFWKIESIINDLIIIGIDGLECFHPDNDMNDIKKYLTIAKKYNLIVTGGSDFHNDTDSRLGYMQPSVDLNTNLMLDLKAKKHKKYNAYERYQLNPFLNCEGTYYGYILKNEGIHQALLWNVFNEINTMRCNLEMYDINSHTNPWSFQPLNFTSSNGKNIGEVIENYLKKEKIIEITNIRIDEINCIESFLRQNIRNGMQIIINVDEYYLSYSNVFFNKHNNKHYLLIDRILDDGLICIIDSESTIKKYITMDEFVMSTKSSMYKTMFCKLIDVVYDGTNKQKDYNSLLIKSINGLCNEAWLITLLEKLPSFFYNNIEMEAISFIFRGLNLNFRFKLVPYINWIEYLVMKNKTSNTLKIHIREIKKEVEIISNLLLLQISRQKIDLELIEYEIKLLKNKTEEIRKYKERVLYE